MTDWKAMPNAMIRQVATERGVELAKARMALAEMEHQRNDARRMVAELADILGDFPLDRAMRTVHIANRYLAAWRESREEET